MGGMMSRNKGKQGEREVVKLLQPIVDRVYVAGGHIGEPPQLCRNLMQSRQGGYDLDGLDWLALEVKRHESGYSSRHWAQAVAQAGAGQVPVLLWRPNRQPWRARCRTAVVTGGWATSPLDVDMDLEAFEVWFEHMVRWHRDRELAR